jgi:hypothetical protein
MSESIMAEGALRLHRRVRDVHVYASYRKVSVLLMRASKHKRARPKLIG